MSPFLSVIIPAHNEEKSICRTIRSLLRQDYRSFEIVIVDDGSTDNAIEKLTEAFGFSIMDHEKLPTSLQYAEVLQILNVTYRDIPIYLMKKENGGKGDTLNAGIDFCRGVFFVSIDADCILPPYTLSQLVDTLERRADIVAIGGRVLPILSTSFDQCGRPWLEKYMLDYQKLEYGIAFSIARPLFDRIGTTMLISGALGLFRTETVIKLGGYALDTVGEDMELVMRIRQSAAKEKCPVGIAYAKGAFCYTEVPWNIVDWIKQRIRWTVGLSEVLWKYRGVLIDKRHSLIEKITFLYYLLFERYAPHIEMTGVIICLICGVSKYALMLIPITVFVQLLLSIVGSGQSIRDSIKLSDNRMKALMKQLLILTSFVSVYHFAHSMIRLVSVPYYNIKKCIMRDKRAVWNSPRRM